MLQCRCSMALLPALLLMLLMQATFQMQAQEECLTWEGTFRDCMCGEMVRDMEKDCQDKTTHYESEVFQEIRYGRPECSKECLNGGTYIPEDDACDCPSGFEGSCCQIEAGTIPGLCGGLLLEPNGTIHTPGFPNYTYPPDVTCRWRISTDPKRKIALSVKNKTFYIEGGSNGFNCDKDTLSIYDGPKKDAKKIGTYCGNQRRRFETIHSTGRHLYIEFSSNSLNELKGFELQYTTFRDFKEDDGQVVSRRCGPRQRYQLETGIITSPNYPVNYGNKEQCEWEIEALPGYDIILDFIEMNMPSRRLCSSGDNITLFKKSSRKSKELITLETFCGNSTYPRYTVKNPYSVKLTFMSDRHMGGTFKIRYNQVKSNVAYEEIKAS